MIAQKYFDAIYHSIKGRLIANVILIHALLMGFIVYDLVTRQAEFMQQQLSAKGYELASILASNASHALLNNDLVALDELLFQMHDIQDNYMIFLLDHTGKVRASTDKSYFNQILVDSTSQTLLKNIEQSSTNTFQNTHHHLIDTIHTIQVKDHIIGYARIILDERNLTKELDIMTKEGFIYTLFAIIIGGLFAWMAIRSVTSKLNDIADAATRLGKKEFDIVLPDIEGKDEVAKVAKAFNVMSQSLNQYIIEQNNIRNALTHAHDELEIIVEERTKDLIDANEKLKSLDELKSMFIASMSHELRTPLNSIIGFTTLVLTKMDGAINQQQEDHLQRVKGAGEHLLSLISDVIDISKIEAGRVEPKYESFILDSLLQKALHEIEILLEKKNLSLLQDIEFGISMFSDERRIHQALLNFLSNAIKYSEQGTITLKVKKEKNAVNISVIDTGIGIKKDDQTKLFEAFERLESHLRVNAGGTGLGLYLSKKIVENILQGEVYFKSVENEGSVFGMIIPLDITT